MPHCLLAMFFFAMILKPRIYLLWQIVPKPGAVERRVDNAIHRRVIFSTAAESNDTRDIELARDKK